MNFLSGTPSDTLRCPALLVTGANGFVMSNAIPVWLALGYRITAVDQDYSDANLLSWDAVSAEDQLETIRASVDRDLLETIPPVDAIIHGAAITAEPQACGMTPEAHLYANLQPALALLEWVAEVGDCRCICLSSSAVYSQTTGIVIEDQPVTPVGTYAVAKATIEATINTLKHVYGRDAVTVRLGNIYGVNEQPNATRPRVSLIGRMLHDALTQGYIELPPQDQPDPQVREWTYAPDIGLAIHALLQVPVLNHALYHAASGDILGRFEIAQIIRQRLPDVRVVAESGSASAPLARRGILSKARLVEDTGFSEWTPVEQGISSALDRELIRQTL